VDRHSVCDTLAGRSRIRKFLLKPRQLGGTEKIGGGSVTVFLAFSVWAAIAAHVEHEHIKQGAVGDFTVDAAGLSLRGSYRHVLVKSAGGACRQQQGIFFHVFFALMLGARQWFARPPVVGYLVIVPWREHRNLCVERAQILVEQIVFVVAAKLSERFGRFRLVLGDDVLPHS